MELCPGVHRVEGVRGANVYLLVDSALSLSKGTSEADGRILRQAQDTATLALVDTGLPGNTEAILGYIRRLGCDPQDLRYILLTHHHPDHAGSLAGLKRATGAIAVAHPAETWADPQARHYLSPPHGAAFLGRLFRHRAVVELLVEDGDVIPVLEGLQVVHTPGHTPGSICLYLPQRRVLFLGDMLLNNEDRLSRPLQWRNRARYEESLRRLASLDFEVGGFGHGPPLLEGAGEAVRQMVARPYEVSLPLIVLKNWLRLMRFPGRLLRRQR